MFDYIKNPSLLICLFQNYVGCEFSVCPFNARHEMPKPELRYHMANCPDRARVEKDLAYGEYSRVRLS